MTGFPDELQINAWSETLSNRSPTDRRARSGLLRTGLAVPDLTAAPRPVDPKDWRDPRVGWGIVLPDDPALGAQDKARAAGAPLQIQELLAERQGVALYYRTDRARGTVRRYYPDGAADDIVVAAGFGTEAGKVPRYLLIYAGPASIPWDFQYEIQHSCFTGRLDLEGPALERYVEALRGDFGGKRAGDPSTLVWAVDQRAGDITQLMRDTVAAPLHDKFEHDGNINARFIDGATGGAAGSATRGVLTQALGEHRPIFVATTSHGKTGPVWDTARMRSDMGLPVDIEGRELSLADLAAAWQPDGAIWYAHACCSAGSASASNFAGMLPPNSDVAKILSAVAGCGDTVAPLPRALLGAERPLRAFVGHVEPTFDWSVRHNKTGQFLTGPLLESFYQCLFTGEPVGMALDSCRRMSSGLLHAEFGSGKSALAAGQDTSGDLFAMKLMARDWKAFVLLGDPTCTIV
jgi:hypothetical protein